MKKIYMQPSVGFCELYRDDILTASPFQLESGAGDVRSFNELFGLTDEEIYQ